MSSKSRNNTESGNQLFPVFLKLNQLRVLLVGAGNIGYEKIRALLENSPEASVDIIAETCMPELLDYIASFPKVSLHIKKFEKTDLHGHDLVIIATGDNELNTAIRESARKLNLLINVADKPDLCDFYLGSVVKKGDLKIGISTNGKSPTIAKRLKELFQESLPDELDQTLDQMNKLRNSLKGDFAHKVNELNKVTSVLISKQGVKKNRINGWYLMIASLFASLIFCRLILG